MERQEMPNSKDHRYQHTNAQEDLLEKGAILQRDGSYAIAPHIPGGVITDPEVLIRIAQVAQKYSCPAIKVTIAQRLAIVGLKEEDIDSAWKDLGMAPGAAIGVCVRSVKICPGSTFCKRGQQDSIGLGMEMDKRYHGMTTPSKMKISISGCPNKCTDTMVNDIGVMGTAKGFTVYVGGNGGITPRLAEKLIEHQTAEQVLHLVDQIMDYYKANAQTNERIGKFMDRVGLEEFRNHVVGDRAVHQAGE